MALHKHQSELALIQREAWLTTVLQSAADPTIVIDNCGCVQFLNSSASRLLSRELAGAAGKHWTDAAPLFDKVSGAPFDDLASLAVLRMCTLNFPRGLLLRKPDGSEVEVEGEVAPSVLRGSDAGAVITIRDVSERNREEAEVRHEQKMLAAARIAERQQGIPAETFDMNDHVKANGAPS